MRVAFVHDFLLQYGGAERTLELLLAIYPGSDVYTLTCDYAAFPKYWRNYKVHSLVGLWLPVLKKYPQLYAGYLSGVMERLVLRDYDVVISSDITFAKMALVGSGTVHIVYQYSPSDMLYHFLPREKYGSWFKALLTGWQKHRLRQRDFIAAQKADRILAISNITQRRIEKYYRRASEVVYPPVRIAGLAEVEALRDETFDSYYLIVSRLVPDKRIDLAVRVCTKYDLQLIVAGEGEERERLAGLAGESISFVGYVDEVKKRALLANCKALLFPATDDFGIVPVECQAVGRGVIAYKQGGVLETVKDGETGVLFTDQTEEGLYQAMKRYEQLNVESDDCRRQVEQFSFEQFREKMMRIVDETVRERVL